MVFQQSGCSDNQFEMEKEDKLVLINMSISLGLGITTLWYCQEIIERPIRSFRAGKRLLRK